MFGLWTLIRHILQVLFFEQISLNSRNFLNLFSRFNIKKIQKPYEIKIMEQSLTI